MFKGADSGDRRLFSALAAEPKPPFTPCSHCGPQNRYEHRFVCRRSGKLYYGCCRATLSATPEVDITTIENVAIDFGDASMHVSHPFTASTYHSWMPFFFLEILPSFEFLG
ncbi:MAG: hypothetical protein WAT81_04600 [Candidatus Moraniibacteriota bacterium]